MKRRAFLTFLAGAAAAAPCTGDAQTNQAMRRVAVMVPIPATDPVYIKNMEGFRDVLERAGWIEGRTVELDIRSIMGSGETYDGVASDIVALAPDVILAITGNSTAALQRRTSTIPIVFVAGVPDPIGSGFVASIARPGGNITGITDSDASLGGKWVQLLKDTAPAIVRVGMIFEPGYDDLLFAAMRQSAEAAAQKLGVVFVPLPIGDEAHIASALAVFASQPNGGLIVAASLFLVAHRAEIIAAAERHRLPAIYIYRYFVAGGGLMSYSVNQRDEFRQAAYLVDRILRGAKPADLPVQATSTYELVVNLKAARAIGLTVPPLLLTGADEVIE